MKSPKEITINYLENIIQEKENILKTIAFEATSSTKINLWDEIDALNGVVEIVKESEGE